MRWSIFRFFSSIEISFCVNHRVFHWIITLPFSQRLTSLWLAKYFPPPVTSGGGGEVTVGLVLFKLPKEVLCCQNALEILNAISEPFFLRFFQKEKLFLQTF